MLKNVIYYRHVGNVLIISLLTRQEVNLNLTNYASFAMFAEHAFI